MRQFLVVLLLSLSGRSITQELPKGVITDSVVCKHAPSQSYALYLPSEYSQQQLWPVVFVFDPMARGALAARVFMSAAEELGYIIVVSNNSRNGSWDIALDAADAMFIDVPDRFSVDTNRIYTSGFSGGSRVALSVAVITQQVRGVIACGAGFPDRPEYHPGPGHAFSYISLIGDRDMNFQEHIEVELQLDNLNISNMRLVFSGIHSWPSPDQIRMAFNWLELEAYKQGYVTSKKWDISSALSLFQKRADSLHNANRLVLAYEAYQQILTDFKGLSDLTTIAKSTEHLHKSKDYQKHRKPGGVSKKRNWNIRSGLMTLSQKPPIPNSISTAILP